MIGGYVGEWGYVEGWGVRWEGGGGTLGRGGGGVFDVRSWSKMLFLGFFWKITTYSPPLDERVRSSFAESCKS